MTKQEQIANYMKSLGISEEEALQLWEDDQEDFIGQEGEEMQKKAKENGRHYEQSTKKRKNTPKERKVDSEKGVLLADLRLLLESKGASNFIQKNEVDLTFDYNGANYTFKLTRHKSPK